MHSVLRSQTLKAEELCHFLNFICAKVVNTETFTEIDIFTSQIKKQNNNNNDNNNSKTEK